MNREAFENLKRVVQAAPENLWCMNYITKQTTCGSAHCAIGWAAIDPWFIKEAKLNSYPIGNTGQWACDSDTLWNERFDFWGVDDETLNTLFGGELQSSDPPIDKQEVLDNIDRILNGDDPVPYLPIRNRYEED